MTLSLPDRQSEHISYNCTIRSLIWLYQSQILVLSGHRSECITDLIHNGWH